MLSKVNATDQLLTTSEQPNIIKYIATDTDLKANMIPIRIAKTPMNIKK